MAVITCRKCCVGFQSAEAYNSHKCKETKMTRQEAVDRVAGLPWNSPGGIVTTLEALGLLKFDDEKDNGVANCIGFTFSLIDRKLHSDLTAVGREFIADLNKSGYKIVRNT